MLIIAAHSQKRKHFLEIRQVFGHLTFALRQRWHAGVRRAAALPN
jgi:hypothetical protein